MTEPYRSDPQYPQPPRKRMNPLAIAAVGCAIAIAAVIGFAAFILTIVFGALRNSTPYEAAVARAQFDPRVIALLGKPVEAKLIVSGTIHAVNDSGTANLDIPLEGPKGKAKLHVAGTKEKGVWTYSEMTVTPENGEPVNLLASTPGSTNTAPPGD